MMQYGKRSDWRLRKQGATGGFASGSSELLYLAIVLAGFGFACFFRILWDVLTKT